MNADQASSSPPRHRHLHHHRHSHHHHHHQQSASSRAPFVPAPPTTQKTTTTTSSITASPEAGDMAATGFYPTSHAFRPMPPPQSPYRRLSATRFFDPEPGQSAASPFPTSPDTGVRVLIRRLPHTTTNDSLRLLIIFSKEVPDMELLPEEDGFRSALLTFRTMAAAVDFKNMLDGCSVSDTELFVDIVASSPTTPASSRNRYHGSLFSAPDRVSPTLPGPFPSHYYLSKDVSTAPTFQNIFSQPPVGNHLGLADRPRISGKLLISSDMGEDDETSDLLKDPVAYAEGGGAQRRATAPHLPLARLANMSLGTHAAGSSSLSYMRSQSPASAPGPSLGYNLGPYQARQSFPPVNPADQNPPCNTLYVGNLPIDTSEEELKAMFSKQRGYKRLCFRTKQNGPMCFVEFEDISFATKALNELYGHPLHNSVKGGIRLSFSKNPLGVRSGQGASPGVGGVNGPMAGNPNGFAIAHGPPPGLAAPPGLGLSRRGTYNLTQPLNTGLKHGHQGSSMPGGFQPSAATYAWNSPVYNNRESSPPLHAKSAYLPRHVLR